MQIGMSGKKSTIIYHQHFYLRKNGCGADKKSNVWDKHCKTLKINKKT
jgi:hypothetical protein